MIITHTIVGTQVERGEAVVWWLTAAQHFNQYGQLQIYGRKQVGSVAILKKRSESSMKERKGGEEGNRIAVVIAVSHFSFMFW